MIQDRFRAVSELEIIKKETHFASSTRPASDIVEDCGRPGPQHSRTFKLGICGETAATRLGQVCQPRIG